MVLSKGKVNSQVALRKIKLDLPAGSTWTISNILSYNNIWAGHKNVNSKWSIG
jgi:hypothetical protein